MAAITTIARGLRFPEGPIAMPDDFVSLWRLSVKR
jgi:hypothetical protein